MSGPGEHADFDAAVAGLARELEALRRQFDPMSDLPSRVEQLAQVAAGLADQLAAHANRGASGPAPSWLDLPAEAAMAHAVLDELTRWMATVYLRYPDAAHSLPDCWLWHPDLIEELLWLMHAWCAAYQGDSACVALVGDWHDRYRPGVVRRISAAAGMCSLENHQGPHRTDGVTGVPVANGAELIARWWANTSRTQPAPEPAAEHLAAAATRRRPGGRR